MKAPRFKVVKTSKGWLVNVPAALSGEKKRARKFFRTREQAEGFANNVRAKFVEHGTSARILPPTQADAATRAFALLGADATPEILIEAAREYVERHNTRLASVPFEEAFRQFTDAQTRSGSYAQSLRQYKARLSSLHGRMLCDITAREVEAAMTGFPPTVFNYGLRILGGLFNYGRKRDLCATNPIEKLDRKKLPPREVEIYTPGEAAALMEAATPSLIPWLATCMFAGLRASEARQMTWGDFDFVENFIRVRAAVSKTRSPRAIPMNANLRGWLLPHRREDAVLIAPQGLNVIRSQLRAAHRTADVKQVKHGPRHSYASYLLARDGDVDALVLSLGHDDPATTFRHYHRVASVRAAKAFWSIYPCGFSEKIVAIGSL
jgi:integrase